MNYIIQYDNKQFMRKKYKLRNVNVIWFVIIGCVRGLLRCIKFNELCVVILNNQFIKVGG